MTRFILLVFCVLACSCQTNRIVNKKRVGLWVETDTVGENIYRSRGRYRKGMEIGRWRYYTNGMLSKNEKYRDSICLTTFYDENRKKTMEGHTKLELSNSYLHWFYFGAWHEFDSIGNITKTRYYENGHLSEIKK